MLVWPVSLPQAPLIGHVERAPDLVVRTTMDAGPDKVRRRFTAGVRPLTMTMIVDESQFSTLDDFFVTTLAGGVLSFDLTVPSTGLTERMRFVGPPEYVLATPTKWRVRLDLEVLP